MYGMVLPALHRRCHGQSTAGSLWRWEIRPAASVHVLWTWSMQLIKLMHTPKAVGDVFNLGGHEEISMNGPRRSRDCSGQFKK